LADVILEEQPVNAWTPDLRNKPLYCKVKYVVVADKSSALKTFLAQEETLDASLHDSTVGQKADVVFKCVPRPYATASLYNAVEGNTSWTVEGKLSLPASHSFAVTGSMIYANFDLDKSAGKCASLHKILTHSLYNRPVGVMFVDNSGVALSYKVSPPGDAIQIVGAIINSIEEVRLVFYDYDDEDLDGNLYVDSTGQYGYLVGKGHVRVTLDNLSDVSLTAIGIGSGVIIGGALISVDKISKLIESIPGVDDTLAQLAAALGTSVKDVVFGYAAGWSAAIADGRIEFSKAMDPSMHADVISKAAPAMMAGGAAGTIAQLASQAMNSPWLGQASSLGIGAGLAIIVHGILAISERWTYVYTHESA
jgi:hypothetical protein